MGNFLTILNNTKKQLPRKAFFEKYSLSKLREYYGIFKSMCDTFAIDDSQFLQIFGKEQQKDKQKQIFEILDDDCNLLIDGLQLFSGLILFSQNSKFEDKINFLFDIFDFNEINSLSKTDLEFLLLSCCNCTYKIMGISVEINDEQIKQLINQNFLTDRRISINQMLKWCSISDQIKRFFQIIQRKPPSVQYLHRNKIYINRTLKNSKKQISLGPKNSFSKQQNREQWIYGITSRIQQKQIKKQIRYSDVHPHTNWVFGMRSLDVKQNILFTKVHSKQVLLYFTACFAIIYYININNQVFYQEHLNQIISISEKNGIVATGELAEYPSIHIWNLQSRKTLFIIKGNLRKGIYLLNFFNDGSNLICCGLQKQTPVVIYQMKTFTLLYSVSMKAPVVQIKQLYSYLIEDRNTEKQFFITTINQVYTQNRKNFDLTPIRIISSFQSAQITTSVAIKMNRKNRYLCYEDNQSLFVILTGHENGFVILWQKQQSEQYSRKIIKKNTHEIVKIQIFQQSIIIATFSSQIEILNLDFSQIYNIDLTNLGLKFLSYNIVNYIIADLSIIIVTKDNDIIRFKEQKFTKNKDLTTLSKSCRINNIINIKGKILAANLFIKENRQNRQNVILYTGGQQGIIYGLNLQSHQLVDTWKLSQVVTAIDSTLNGKGYCVLVAGTLSGKIYVRLNWEQIEKTYECGKCINDIKVINSGGTILAGCQDRYLYILTNLNKNFFTSTRKLEIGAQIPKSIQVLENKILVSTNENNLYMVSLVDFKYKLVDLKKQKTSNEFNESLISLQYFKKFSYPFIYSPKIIAIASLNRGFICWKNNYDIVNKTKKYILQHSSRITKILISPDLKYFITVGYQDSTISVSRLLFTNQKNILNYFSISSKPSVEYDELIQRQILYCYYKNNIIHTEHDQHLLVRGVKNQTLKILLKRMMIEWKEMNKNSLKISPNINISLEFVYGIQSFNRRNNILYVENPKRFVYYISRVIVLYNPQANQQQFYMGHRHKITSICLLSEGIIASSQSAYNPSIYIWNYNTLQTLNIIKTKHQNGILHMCSSDNFILTCGIEQDRDKLKSYQQKTNFRFSLQIIDYRINQITSFHQQGLQVIYSMAINPLNKFQFVTTGDNNVTFWVSKVRTLYKQSVCQTKDQTITACEYFTFNINKKSVCDIIVGTRRGNIGIVTNKNRFIVIKERAHQKFINCIKIIKNNDKVLLITSGQDEWIRIWNKEFDCIYEQEIRKIEYLKDLSKMNSEKKYFEKGYMQNNLSVQSITILYTKETLSILFLTRNGQVIQSYITLNQYTIRQSKSSLYLRNHCSQNQSKLRKIYFAMHPKFEIMVTVGQDQNLFIWDVEKNKLITSKILGYIAYPSSIKFNKEGDILVIGFTDGLIIFLDSKMIKSNQGKSDEKYIIPTLSLIHKHKNEKKAAILNIEFSESAEYLAVSYDNSLKEKSKFDTKKENQPSFISLFKTKEKLKNKNQQNDKLYHWLADIRCQHAQKIYQTKKQNIYGMASYFMTFGQSDEKSLYLLIYYQIFDANHIRLNNLGDQNYIIWDVNTSTIVVNLESVSHIFWKKLNFPSSIDCKYQFYKDQIDKKKIDKKVASENKISEITSMFNVDSKNFMFLGSLNGDIHICQTNALEYNVGFGKFPDNNQRFLAKTYAAHTSFINQIQLSNDQYSLYTSAIEDQCILKWKIGYQIKSTQIQEGEDLFCQVPDNYLFTKNLQTYIQRDQIRNIAEKIDDKSLRNCLQFDKILGRKSVTSRNNIYYDYMNRIIYTTGKNVILFDSQERKQEYLFKQQQEIDHSYQITAVTLHTDRRLIAIGSSGTRSNLLLWDLRSRVYLKNIKFLNIVSIILLRFNFNGQYIILYGLDNQKIGIIYLVDWRKSIILGTVKNLYSVAWKIKDAAFFCQGFQNFVTCGVNHLVVWKLRGKQLTYENIQVIREKQASKNFIFFSIIQLQNQKIITCCDSGYLHLWDNNFKLVNTKKAHQDMCLVLTTNNKNEIISGAKDSSIVLWKVENDQLFVLAIYKLKDFISKRKLNEKNQFIYHEIQSLDIKSNNILIGSKSGSIYQLSIQLEKNIIQLSQIKQILWAHDFDIVKGMFFNQDESRFFEITKTGLLSVWDLNNLKCLYSFDFANEVIDIVFSQKHQLYFIVFINEIITIKKDDFTFTKDPTFRLKFRNKIITVALSKNQKMLAVAIEKSAQSKPRIYTYQIVKSNTFKQLHEDFLSNNPIYIDLSTDNNYILFKDDEKELVLDARTFANVNIKKYNQIQWINEGIRVSPRVAPIIKIYKEQDNAINKIIQLSQNLIMICDSVGTIRIYEIKKSENLISLVYYNLMHLNNITKACISKSRKSVATFSESDRSIIIWKINEDAIRNNQ